MRKIIYILAVLVFVGFLSCKKESESTVPVVSNTGFSDSIFTPTSAFSFVSPAGTVIGYPNIDTVYYYLPTSVKVNSQSSLTSSYAWFLRRPAVADSLLSNAQNPVFAFTFPIPYGSVVLVTSNNSGTDTIVKPFQLRTAPNGLRVTSITIDTMSFINPATLTYWNDTSGAETGADVFCQMTSGSTMVMDTVFSTGWASAPTAIAGSYPVKVNLTATPYTLSRPTSTKNFTISSAISGVTMLDTFMVKMYHRNVVTTNAELIGEAPLIPSNYFGGTLPTVIYISNPSQNLYLKLNVQWL